MDPRVSIIVPCHNEIRFIRAFLDSVAQFERPEGLMPEVLIADGCSTDGTRELLDEFAAAHYWLRVIPNPRRIVSTGLNLAIKAALGDVMVRLDVHATYSPDYVVQCLKVLEETGADNVGGAARTRPQGYMQDAVAAAYHSRFSTGGALFHQPDHEGPVDTVTFGCWHKVLFEEVGLFDEDLMRNQDDEHNLRITLAGGTIYQSPRIRCWYETRSSLAALFTQYRQYGYWKVAVIHKHGRVASWRHLIPATFVGSLGLLAVSALFSHWARLAFCAASGTYLAAVLVASLLICIPRKVTLLAVMPFVLATFHFSYGLGFLAGLLRKR